MRRAITAAALAIGSQTAVPSTLPSQSTQSVATLPTDLLALASASPDAALPPGWQTRAVRGQRLPMTEIIDSSGMRYLRVSGTDRAGWFIRELPSPIPVGGGRLHWAWRAPLAPRGASVGAPATDDAAIRIVVVFARQTRFLGTPRVLFYTLADGEPEAQRGPLRSPFGVIMAGRPAQSVSWVNMMVEPFRDYLRLWGTDPTRIVAIGVMQDTEQTRTAAIGDVRQLEWRKDDASTR